MKFQARSEGSAEVSLLVLEHFCSRSLRILPGSAEFQRKAALDRVDPEQLLGYRGSAFSFSRRC